nr:hypothetical protein [Tanacetum cinerariifolium]
MEMLITINPLPHPSTYANTNVEFFSSVPIPIQESDPHQDQIDIITSTDDVLPPSIKNDDLYEEEVDDVDDLRVDNFIQNSKHEFSEIVRNAIVKFECIDARVKFDVFFDENDDLSNFMFVIFDKVFSLLSAESEDTIFDPGSLPYTLISPKPFLHLHPDHPMCQCPKPTWHFPPFSLAILNSHGYKRNTSKWDILPEISVEKAQVMSKGPPRGSNRDYSLSING